MAAGKSKGKTAKGTPVKKAKKTKAAVKAPVKKSDNDIPNSTVALLLVLTLVLMLWSSVVFIQNIKLINAAPYNSSGGSPNSSGGATLTIQGHQTGSSQASAGFTLLPPKNGTGSQGANTT